MTEVTLRGLRKSFGDNLILDDIDLAIPSGRVTAVLGPSGCGKTTLLRLIAGFLVPDDGTIELGGQPIAGDGTALPSWRRRIGYVAQQGALFPHLDLAGNIAFGLPRRRRRNRQGVAELMDLVGLSPELLQRFPHELSGGQQQRVAVARALAPGPAVVLLDEPFSSLDTGLRDETGRAVMRALEAAGVTVVLVTHDQDEALRLADQVAVMRAGRLAQAGTPREIYERPADRGVAEFVGTAVVLSAVIDDGEAMTMLGRLGVSGAPAGPARRGTLLLRPEQLALTAAGTVEIPAPARTTSARAHVRGVDYHGHHATVQLVPILSGPLASGQADSSAGTDAPDVLISRVHGPSAPRPGDLVDIEIIGMAAYLGP